MLNHKLKVNSVYIIWIGLVVSIVFKAMGILNRVQFQQRYYSG